ARVLRDEVGRVEPGHLHPPAVELDGDEVRGGPAEQLVEGGHAPELAELDVVVVVAEPEARLLGSLARLVEQVRVPLPVVQGQGIRERRAAGLEAGRVGEPGEGADDESQAQLLGVIDAGVEALPQRRYPVVGTDALEPRALQGPTDLSRLPAEEAVELDLLVADRRDLLEGPLEVLAGLIPHGVELAP